MVELIKEKIKIFFLFCAVLLSGCANQLPPGGGGVDLVPPAVMNTYPKNGTTDFKNDFIEIDFSKFIIHQTFSEALFISPAINGQLEYDWTGTSVKVYFPEKLKENVTYVVSIGSNVQDFNNHNRMAESYSFVFSTGSQIDKGIISGKIYSDKPGGLLVFAYIKSDSAINPLKYKPDYISQTGKEGSYKLLGLKNGEYRIFAVRDQYMDLIYQPEQDEIGIPYEDVNLSDEDTLFSGLNFFVTKFDTVKPRLVSAVMTDKNHVLLKFSKQIDSSSIKPSNFLIIDSTSGKSITPVYAFKGNTKPEEIVLAVDSAFPQKDQAFVETKSIKDLFENVFQNDFASLTLSEKPDTTKPNIYSTLPANGNSSSDFTGQNFTFYFNDAFNSAVAEKGIAFTDTSGTPVSYRIRFIDNASFVIEPKNNLETNKDYRIKLDLSKFIDIAGNKFDSTYIYKFKTINGLDFTGISGRISGTETGEKPYLVLENFEKGNNTYKLPAGKNDNFEFKRIIPGKYRLWCFEDDNNNGKYDYGKAYPYEPSEQFWVYPDTLNLRARWTQTNINFNIDKH